MSTTLGIVEVCSTGSSLATATSSAALASRRFGGKSLLDWVVRRVSDSLLLDKIAVVTHFSHGDLVYRLAPPDVSVFVGTQADSLGRVAAAAREFEATQVVRIPLSCPFVDPELIDRLVCTATGNPDCDFIGYFSVDGRPAVLSKLGVFAEWCRTSALFAADERAKSAVDRANPMQYLFTHPESFQLRFIPIPTKLDRRDLRLTIEAEEDLEHAHLIFEALGPERLDWRRIVELLDEHPALRERMAILNEAVA